MFREYDIFTLAKQIPGEDIPVGARGVVLMVFTEPRRAYEVEFVDANGRNLGSRATFTLNEEYMMPLPG